MRKQGVYPWSQTHNCSYLHILSVSVIIYKTVIWSGVINVTCWPSKQTLLRNINDITCTVWSAILTKPEWSQSGLRARESSSFVWRTTFILSSFWIACFSCFWQTKKNAVLVFSNVSTLECVFEKLRYQVRKMPVWCGYRAKTEKKMYLFSMDIL